MVGEMDRPGEPETPSTARVRQMLTVDPIISSKVSSKTFKPFNENNKQHHSILQQQQQHQHSYSYSQYGLNSLRSASVQSMAPLPPTPMSAYFDAEDVGDGFDEENEYNLSSSSSPPTSSGTGFTTYNSNKTEYYPSQVTQKFGMNIAGDNAFRMRKYDKSTSLNNIDTTVHQSTKSFSSPSHNVHEIANAIMSGFEEIEEEAQEGDRSHSSETDSPGPITPATPGLWKPRELTLLRSRKPGVDSEMNGSGQHSSHSSDSKSATTTIMNASSNHSSSSTAVIPATAAVGSERTGGQRALEGLGIRGLTTATASSPLLTNSDRRSSRIIARDILPTINTSSPATSHYRTMSQSTSPTITTPLTTTQQSSSHVPRELKLAASTGPPSSMRMHNFTIGNVNSPTIMNPSSFHMLNGVVHQYSSRIPPLNSSSNPAGTAPMSSNNSAPQPFSAPSPSRIPVRHGPAFSPSDFQNKMSQTLNRSTNEILLQRKASTNVKALTLDERTTRVEQMHSPSISTTSPLLSDSSQRLSRSLDDFRAMFETTEKMMFTSSSSRPEENKEKDEEGRGSENWTESSSDRKSSVNSLVNQNVDKMKFSPVSSPTPSFSQHLSSGSRRRKPPAPLILVPSSPSSYSNSSAGQSQPNSALSMVNRSPNFRNTADTLPTLETDHGESQEMVDRINPKLRLSTSSKSGKGFLSPGVPSSGRQSGYLSQSPNSAVAEQFSTPLQSPAPLSDLGIEPSPTPQSIASAVDSSQMAKGRDSVTKSAGRIESASNNLKSMKPEKDTKHDPKSPKSQLLLEKKIRDPKPDQNADEDEKSVVSNLESTSVRSSEVGNAFEFDNIPDSREMNGEQQKEKNSSTDNDKDLDDLTAFTSGLVGQSGDTSIDSTTLFIRPSSPAALMKFNRDIFTSKPNEGKRVSRVDDESENEVVPLQPSGPPPGVPLPTVPGQEGWTTSEQSVLTAKKQESFNSHLRARSTEGGRRRSSASSGRAVNVEEGLVSVSPTNTRAMINHPASGGQANRTQHRSKPSIVPAVPSFGYMGTSSTRVSPSPMSPIIEPMQNTGIPMPISMPQEEDEQFGTSRWSSGSEDEDDRLKSPQGRKSISSRSRKGSQAGISSSNLSSRRNTGSASTGSLAPLKKSSIFSSLGLRKKSFAALSSEISSLSSSPLPSLSDSPAIGKGEIMKEFPFPAQQQTQPRLSLAANLKAMAANSGTPSSPVISSPISASRFDYRPSPKNPTYETNIPPRSLQRQASTPLLNDRFSSLGGNSNPTFMKSNLAGSMPRKSNQLTPRPSDASLSTTASSQGYGSATRATSTGSNDSSIPSPAMDRSMQANPYGLNASVVSAISLQGLGIQVAKEQNRDDVAPVEVKAFGSNAIRARSSDANMRSSIKSHQSTESISNMHDRFERHIAAVTSARLQFEQQQQKQNRRESKESKRGIGVRQRSATSNSSDRSSIDARNAAYRSMQKNSSLTNGMSVSAIPPPLPIFSSTSAGIPPSPYNADLANEPHGMTTISPDETPRIAYASLSTSSHNSPDLINSPEAKQRNKGLRRKSTDEEALVAMGKALFSAVSSPTVSSSAHHHHHKDLFASLKGLDKGAKNHRVRANPPKVRPHYPSLTDFGREWQAQHPQEAFCAAVGPALLEWTLQKAVESNGQESECSASDTDDYGASDGGENAPEVRDKQFHHYLSGEKSKNRNQGDMSSDDDQKKRQNVKRIPVKEEITSDIESTDSEDSYGISDDEYENAPSYIDPRIVAAGASKTKPETFNKEDTSADDVPLGLYIENASETLKRLQRSQTTGGIVRKKKLGSSIEAAEMSSAKLDSVLDVNALSEKLLNVQRSRSTTIPKSGRREVEGDGETSSKHLDSDGLRKIVKSIPSYKASTSRSYQMEDLFSAPSSIIPSSDGATMYTASEMRSSSRPSDDENAQIVPQSTIVSDFAEMVRLRSQHRSRVRPMAMKFNENTALPPTPTIPQSQPNRRPEKITVPEHRNPPPPPKDILEQNPHQQLVEHRIYILNRTKFQLVRLPPAACAREMVKALMRIDAMPVDGRVGGWAIFDVCPELGIERPLREYERTNDIMENRMNPQRDYFMLRRTDLAPYLSIQALPKSSPALAGWLYVQESGNKRGWNKRWLELRDHTLYQAKSERGREEMRMCSLSEFDVFLPIEGEVWVNKAPKKNVFAMRNIVKSNDIKHEDNQTFYFCLSDPRAARHWITAINRARTFLMRQEKPHLFVQPQQGNIDGNQRNANLDSIRGLPAPPIVPQRPLVHLDTELFEQGSLLNAFSTQTMGLQQPQQPLPPRGSSVVDRKPIAVVKSEKIDRTTTSKAEEEQRGGQMNEEIREAERNQRALGRPLIGIVAERSLHANGQSSNPK